MNKLSLDALVREEGVAYTTRSPIDRIEIARRGVSKSTLLRIADWSSISVKELATLLPVSLRTIQRYEDDELLETHVSERLLLIFEVLEKGLDVFGTREKSLSWLHAPHLAFGKRTPLSLLDTGFGIRLVMDTLGKIEHGIVS